MIDDGIRVVTVAGTLVADRVVVTLPLGVLAADAVVFVPPLPPWKQQAIRALGVGRFE